MHRLKKIEENAAKYAKFGEISIKILSVNEWKVLFDILEFGENDFYFV
jgi:hypothetical protein